MMFYSRGWSNRDKKSDEGGGKPERSSFRKTRLSLLPTLRRLSHFCTSLHLYCYHRHAE